MGDSFCDFLLAVAQQILEKGSILKKIAYRLYITFFQKWFDVQERKQKVTEFLSFTKEMVNNLSRVARPPNV